MNTAKTNTNPTANTNMDTNYPDKDLKTNENDSPNASTPSRAHPRTKPQQCQQCYQQPDMTSKYTSARYQCINAEGSVLVTSLEIQGAAGVANHYQ